ncbi:MAG: tetratricopeptide repeat protein [Planctomycetes bacterium]|nr:tetratricopeptide repeat protein [Planctomycetota bacterium]
MPGKVTDDRSIQPVRRRGQRDPARASEPRSVFPGGGRPADEVDPRPDDSIVRGLYTVPMMAAVLGVPVAAVRHWQRSGLLEPTRRAGALEWFDFQQLVVGRRLVRLLAGGFSLREIDAKLATLAPGGAAEAARASGRIVTDGRRLSIRRDNRLLGAGGQLQFGFYAESLAGDDDPMIMPLAKANPGTSSTTSGSAIGISLEDLEEPTSMVELLDLAADLEAAGEFAEAAEAIRAVLQAEPPTAQVVFMLAELLYRAGDLTAARERYYAAVELDADHLEARASLGCVLAELHEHELAIAALEGVLRQQPDYADAHWHMAGVLDQVGRTDDAARHLRTFLTLAPASPWAKLARQRLDE